jgi:hypothetical protein
MDTQTGTASRQLTLEEKLNTLLKLVSSEGRNVADVACTLADKISGSQPSPECPKAPSPISDCAHSIVDELARELESILRSLSADLGRSHRAIGEFGRDRIERMPPSTQFADLAAKQSAGVAGSRW